MPTKAKKQAGNKKSPIKTRYVVLVGVSVLVCAWIIGQTFLNSTRDSFDDASLEKWTVVSGDWSVVDGVLVNTGTGGSDRNVIVLNVLPEGDFELSCKMRISEQTGAFLPQAQLVFGYQDSNDFWFGGLGAYDSFCAVGQFVEGVHSMKDSVDSGVVESSRWYDVRLSVVGDIVTFYVDGVETLSFTEDISGYVGLTGWFGTVYFDDVELNMR